MAPADAGEQGAVNVGVKGHDLARGEQALDLMGG